LILVKALERMAFQIAGALQGRWPQANSLFSRGGFSVLLYFRR